MPDRRAAPFAETAAVSLRGLSKRFREAGAVHSVLEDVDLQVQRGDLVALLGRSGTGKTTLLNLISGIESPDAGEISVGGESLSGMDEHARTMFRRRHIGFVFQFFNLLPTLTVEENVRLPLQLTGAGRDRERALSLLDRVGLAGRAMSFPDRLSGGEQQRVAVARALAHDPALLLADEPTGNLDVEVGRRLLDMLTGLADDHGKTMIVATHSHEVAARAGRVYRIRDHRLSRVAAEEL